MSPIPRNFKLPEPANLNSQDLLGLAHRYRTHLGKFDNSTIDYFVQREFMTLSRQDSASTSILIDQNGFAYIDTSRRPSDPPHCDYVFRVYYLLAYKLIHWPRFRSQHPSHGLYVPYDAAGNVSLEACKREAEIFSIFFAMPREPFREKYENGTASDFFDVSPELVDMRANMHDMRS